MKAHGRTRAACASVVGIAFLLAGCDFFAGLANPLIGSWRTTVQISSASTMVMTLDIHADKSLDIGGTFTGSTTGTITGSGTYTQNTSTETITIDGSMTTTVTGQTPDTATITAETIPYTINSDKDIMTWTDTSGILTGAAGAAVVWLRR